MEEDLIKLNDKFEKYAKQLGFSDDYVRKSRYEFKRLSSFMIDNNLTVYCRSVGEKFIAFRNQLQETKKSKQKYPGRNDIRYITLINGFLNGEWIMMRCQKDYDAAFSGKFGACALQVLNEYSEERRLNIKSRRLYYGELSKFCEYLHENTISSLSEITSEIVLDFFSKIKTKKDAAATALRFFLKDLYNKGHIDFRTSKILEKVKTRSTVKLPSNYTPTEILCIENSIDRKYPKGKRNYAMVLLATRLGLRSSDIRELQFSNIDWDLNIVNIEQYKTAEPLQLPLFTEVGEAILDYILHARVKSNSKFIFLRLRAPYLPITASAFVSFMNEYFSKSNIECSNKRQGPHSMRHSIATNMLTNGVSLPVISQSLGHSNIISTMKYLHTDILSLRNCSLDVPIVSPDFYSKNRWK